MVFQFEYEKDGQHGYLNINATETGQTFNYSQIGGRVRSGQYCSGWLPMENATTFKSTEPRLFSSRTYKNDNYLGAYPATFWAVISHWDGENVMVINPEDEGLWGDYDSQLGYRAPLELFITVRGVHRRVGQIIWGYENVEDPLHPGQYIPNVYKCSLHQIVTEDFPNDTFMSLQETYRRPQTSWTPDTFIPKVSFWVITMHDDIEGSVSYGEDFDVLVFCYNDTIQQTFTCVDLRALKGAEVKPIPSKSSTQGNTPTGFRGGRDDHSDSDTVSTIGTGLDTAFVNAGQHGVRLYRINATSSGVGVPSQYDDLYNCFWSENFWDKYENAKWNPLSGIISLHMMPCDPTDADGRPATFTTNQQIYVAGQELSYVYEPGPPIVEFHAHGDVPDHSKAQICTSTFHPLEYSHSFLDWGANTRARLRLPFIGIVPVEISKVMEGGLFAKYNIDFLTGNCLVQVYTVPSKEVMGEEGDWDEDYGGCVCLIAEYSGNCAQKLNFAGNDYGGNYAAGYVGGVASTALSYEREGTDNFINHMGYSIIGGYLDYKIRSKHHIYNIPATANVSTMGMMIPALIIDRPIDITPLDENGEATVFEHFNGRPSASGGTVKDYKDFDMGEGVFIKGIIHADTLYATEDEKRQIEKAFAKGVYL